MWDVDDHAEKLEGSEDEKFEEGQAKYELRRRKEEEERGGRGEGESIPVGRSI